MERLTKEQRKKNMQAIKSKGSKIEILLSKAMWKRGIRYRKNDRSIFGVPDFTIKKLKIAIFCDSEFWHGKNWDVKKKEFKTNIEFWQNKIEKNISRDKQVTSQLNKSGWCVIRLWGKEIKKNIEKCIIKIEEEMKKQKIKLSLEEFYLYEAKKRKNDFSLIGKAALTHYINNTKENNPDILRKEALNEVKRIMEYENPEEPITQEIAENALQYLIEDFKSDIPFPEPENPVFTFIDLFAGIGGFRIAMQELGGKCVFSSELDKQAQKTYEANFGEIPFGDITRETTKQFIPDNFDLLCAGFPCQAFSIAGKRGGFEDTRGTLFFEVAEIIRKKRPKAIFLENVKGLINHDKGKTLKTILNVLRKDLNYFVPEPKIVNAKDFGVPQNRERIYIVGFRDDLQIENFEYPKPLQKKVSFSDIKEKGPVSVKYFLSDTYLNTLVKHKERHESKGNGFGYEIIEDNNIANAVVCGGMGRERNLVIDFSLTDYTPVTRIKGEVNRQGIRKMTPREWARLQGFPENYIIPVADASAYKQFGNSVAVPAIYNTGKEILQRIMKYVKRK